MLALTWLFGWGGGLMVVLGLFLFGGGLVSSIRRLGPVEDRKRIVFEPGSGLVVVTGVVLLVFGLLMLLAYLVVVRG